MGETRYRDPVGKKTLDTRPIGGRILCADLEGELSVQIQRGENTETDKGRDRIHEEGG